MVEHIPDKMKATTDNLKDHHVHFLTKPMFEVFTITIHSDNNNPIKSLHDGKPCHIRGIVRVIDKDSTTTYDLYNRQSDNAEIITLGGSIPLTNFSIVPFKTLKFTILLYDVAHHIEFANGVFNLDYSKSYDYNNVHIARVDGEHGFAHVHHSTFQHAVIASVDRVEFCRSNANNRVFGTVIARLKRIYGHWNNHEYPNTVLFDNRQYPKQSTNLQAQFNTPIKLVRSCLVVPVDCSLIIEADFCDDMGRKYAMEMHLNAYPQGLNKGSVTSQDCKMLVDVDWRHAYDAFPLKTKVKDLSCVKEKPQVSGDTEQSSTLFGETTNYTKLTLEAQRPSSSISRRQPCPAIRILSSCVEVFSVLICVDDKEVEIFGKIEVRDSARRPFNIFNGHQRLSDQKALSIVGPIRSFKDKPFSMHVDLKDGKGRVVSKGTIAWNCNGDDPISWYDRHICSVIRGDIGYAAIHYSMITYGAQVGIELSFTWPCGFDPYGSITAWYKNYVYPTLYDEQYYKIMLFSNSPEESSGVKTSNTPPLQLLKSCVSVPLVDSLTVDVNLELIGPFKGIDDKHINNNVDFQALMEFSSDVSREVLINEGDCSVRISTEVGKIGLPEVLLGKKGRNRR